MLIDIRHGLDVAREGAPVQVVHQGPDTGLVGVIGLDYPDVRPSLVVQEGDRVGKGEPLFADRTAPSICVTAPSGGSVREINRGPRRSVVSVVIERDDVPDRVFPSYAEGDLDAVDVGEIRQLLQTSGMWPAFGVRPLGRMPSSDSTPVEIFVTAIDTSPLAPDPAVVIGESEADFAVGLRVLSALAGKTLYLCCAPGARLPGTDVDKLVVAEFGGPHPAGLPGTHLHYLNGNQAKRSDRWHIGYQDVIAIGHVFSRGELPAARVVALGGSGVTQPRLLRVTPGCDISALLRGEVDQPGRVISGSVLSGRETNPATHYLGCGHSQVSVLAQPGSSDPQTGMLAVESLERVWPFSVPPLPLLRALLINDTETAMALGCLDLATEDLALCAYVCPARLDYAGALQETVAAIERRG